MRAQERDVADVAADAERVRRRKWRLRHGRVSGRALRIIRVEQLADGIESD